MNNLCCNCCRLSGQRTKTNMSELNNLPKACFEFEEKTKKPSQNFLFFVCFAYVREKFVERFV